MYNIAVAVLCILLMIGLAVAANRFAKRRRASGDWDEKGPRHPTNPPPGFLNPRYGARGDLEDLFPPQNKDEDR